MSAAPHWRTWLAARGISVDGDYPGPRCIILPGPALLAVMPGASDADIQAEFSRRTQIYAHFATDYDDTCYDCGVYLCDPAPRRRAVSHPDPLCADCSQLDQVRRARWDREMRTIENWLASAQRRNIEPRS